MDVSDFILSVGSFVLQLTDVVASVSIHLSAKRSCIGSRRLIRRSFVEVTRNLNKDEFRVCFVCLGERFPGSKAKSPRYCCKTKKYPVDRAAEVFIEMYNSVFLFVLSQERSIWNAR